MNNSHCRHRFRGWDSDIGHHIEGRCALKGLVTAGITQVSSPKGRTAAACRVEVLGRPTPAVAG
jgi:hypothetical protein